MYQIFEGMFKGGEPFGQGRCILDNGDCIEGYWLDAYSDPEGDIFYLNGGILKRVNQSTFKSIQQSFI